MIIPIACLLLKLSWKKVVRWFFRQFWKIKQVLCHKRRMNECICLLVTVVHSGDVQSKLQQFTNKYKTTYHNGVITAVDGS